MALGFAVVGGRWNAQPGLALFNDADSDSVVDVREEVLGSNPNDPGSEPEDFLLSYFGESQACDDGLDNDLDGTTDAADSGCVSDDPDPFSNQLESTVGSDPEDGVSYPEDTRFDAVLASIGYARFQSCDNEEDDDGDGAVDAADSGCEPISSDADRFDDLTEKLFGSDPNDASSVPEHELVNPGSCSDGIDNDQDGTRDGGESACRPVTNDAFSDARTITTLPFEDALKLTGSSTELGEPRSECGFGGQEAASVWYAYTPSTNAALAADSTGSDFPNVVAIWTRSGEQFRDVACSSSASPASLGAHAPFQAVAGQTYYIQIIGPLVPDTPADVQFALGIAHPPANDNFSAATQITAVPFEDRVNVTDATTEQDEPESDCGESYSTAWYRYVATNDQLLIASSVGSGYPVRLSVWTDSPFGLAEVACTGSRGRVALDVEAGRAYYFQAAAPYQGIASELTFSLTPSTPPPNDDFANATNVSSLPYDDTVDTFTASTETGEPESSCSFGEQNATVWYRITAQQSGYITASSGDPGDFLPVVWSAYRGTSLTDLTELACSTPFRGSNSLSVAVEAGDTVFVQIGTLPFESVDEFTVHLAFLSVPSCAPAQLTVSDPLGDPFVFGTGEDIIDATSISGGGDGTNYCIDIRFANPLPPAAADSFDNAGASIAFDTDSNSETGPFGADFPCGATLAAPGHGSEVRARIELRRDVIVPLDIAQARPPSGAGVVPRPPVMFAVVVYGQRSLQIILPMTALGDTAFYVDVSFNGTSNTDCVPNGGAILSPTPAAMGDTNCDGRIDSVDSSLILQRVANLLTEDIVCQYAGDVFGSDGVGPIDALLILQFNAGMLSEFPGGR